MRNRQPDGGLSALGSSPRTPDFALACSVPGSATGAESISPWVYGCARRQVHLVGGPRLDQFARYMSPMRLDR